MPFLTVADLVPFNPDVDPVKAQAMIDDASALAAAEAPQILSVGFAHGDAVKALLRGAVLRWLEAGTGARRSVQVGSVSTTFDNTSDRRVMFLPAEVARLRALGATSGGSFTLSLGVPDASA